MHGNRLRYAFLLFAVFALIGYSGCILSPSEEVPQPQPKPSYKPLTDRDNILYNLMQCYKEHNIDRYVEILDLNAFYWHDQDGVVKEKDKDVEQTGKMFQAAEHGASIDPKWWLDKLELTIYSGNWTQTPKVDGVECADCWETTRSYYITAVLSGGATTYIGDAKATFIAIGVDEGGKRIYRLRHIYDIPNL
jgi:hypothetical protein